MTTAATVPSNHVRGPMGGRWVQLVIGIVCMTMISNLQYGWTLFVGPIGDKFHWQLPAIQVAFTIFIMTETWLVPIEGYLVDRLGPRIVVVGASFLVAGSWILNSRADSLPQLYFAAVIGGIGAGAVYSTCIGNALKWFPDRRGLAAGLTAGGFGAGAALTVFPIAAMIKSSGYEATFFIYGIAQGVIIFLLGWLLRPPGPELAGVVKPGAIAPSVARDYAPLEMLRTPVFWIMYVMFVLMASGGLMATAQLAPIANDFQIADAPVSLMGLTLPALTFALSLNRVLNGVSRPFFGWLSDLLGRENTMFVAFCLEGGAIFLLSQFGRNPTAFVVLTGLVFFGWGEIYSLFPATCGDAFGRRFASANAGLLYTAKGVASLLVPVASVIGATQGWHTVFVAAGVMNFIAASMALFLLKPLRARMGAAPFPTAPPPNAQLEPRSKAAP
ncbi:MAG TPA: oxalate/formate MFS antiporter [Gemmatimonadaceae bacterium]|nr:oxalate/formate MFS antiporter [Gemmatimonadaceae bacterium]